MNNELKAHLLSTVSTLKFSRLTKNKLGSEEKQRRTKGKIGRLKMGDEVC